MDQGIGISAHDLLAGIGFIAFYIVCTLAAIYQWRHPENVPYKRFPFHKEPGERTTPRRVRFLRLHTVLALVILNAFAVGLIVEQMRHMKGT